MNRIRLSAALVVVTLLVLATPSFLQLFEPSPISTLIQPHSCGHAGSPCTVKGRHYSALVPIGPGPFPVVLFFHGSVQSGDKSIRRKKLIDPLIRQGYAVVAPTALDVTYSGNRRGTGWLRQGKDGDRDDHQFVRDVLADIEDRFPLDMSRILVMGSSNGAIFSWYLACAQIDARLKAFVPIAGTPIRDQPGLCKDNPPIGHILQVHGRRDRVVPFEGSVRTYGNLGYLGAREAVENAAARLECDNPTEFNRPGVPDLMWSGCSQPASFSLAAFDAGHGVPRNWAAVVLPWFEGQYRKPSFWSWLAARLPEPAPDNR